MSIEKPSSTEEEYFKREEIAKLRSAREEEARRLNEDQRKKAKDLHFMKCPKCGMDLQEVELQSVTLDKCFSCGGLWLDEGELDRVKGADAGGFLNSIKSIFSK